MVHWSHEISGSSRGTEYSQTVAKVKKSHRRCNGIIQCDNPSCHIVVRPYTRTSGRENQLSFQCQCGSHLSHVLCSASWTVTTIARGVRHFEHKGNHTHPRLTHQLHLSGPEKAEFEALVLSNPKAGPLELSVGIRGFNGPGKFASDIAVPLLNKDRVKAERNNVRRGSKGDLKTFDAGLNEFTELCGEEDFVKSSTLGEVTVISMQTPTMVAELVKEFTIKQEPVNGIVFDAAHGFWLERNHLLIISSFYSCILKAWMPALMSFSNGATAHISRTFST